MALRAQKSAFHLVGMSEGRQVWAYSTREHLLDIMIKPTYFARLSTDIGIGDIVLVDCPGFYELVSILGNPTQPIHRLGGGILQAVAQTSDGSHEWVIVMRGLQRFLNPLEAGRNNHSMPSLSKRRRTA